MTPVFINSKAGCATLCSLAETGVEESGYESRSIADFNWANGEVTIASDDISLHGTSMELTVVCEDPVSKSASTSATTSATVFFNNPCYDTTILQELIEDKTFTANLWEPIFYPLPTATSEISCGPITYRLNGLETPEPFEIETHDGQFGFWIRLTDISMATSTPFSLDACITIGGVDEVCKS